MIQSRTEKSGNEGCKSQQTSRPLSGLYISIVTAEERISGLEQTFLNDRIQERKTNT